MLARTIADLAGSDAIQQVRIAEALHLRQAEVDVMTIICLDGDIRSLHEQTLIRFYFLLTRKLQILRMLL